MVRYVDLIELGKTDPLRSLRLQYFPDKRLATILVRSVENRIENIRVITRAIAMSGGRIMIMRPSNPAGKIIDILYVVDCPPGKEIDIASRVEELGRAKEVLIIKMPEERLALNVLFPYMVMGRRGMIITESILEGFTNGVREKFGESGAEAFLYLIGLDIGREIFTAIRPLLAEKTVAESLKLLGHIMRSLGMCRLKSISVKDEVIEMEILDGVEASSLKKRYTAPQCHNTRGLLAGFLNELTGERWSVEEVKCEAAGDDCCKFRMKVL
ncbi:MAG: hypothetical protein DRN68_07360 [Thaumarchaeota archaeon]|nr:MAG: hypothetical protein DRN68_07360 [Nitrososphaerota archaeon]